jgi:4-azaleucine resistance transporter AzlC
LIETMMLLSPPMSNARRMAFLTGVKAELPILVGVMPFGMIYGVLALGAGLPPAAAQAMSSIVFAGSSQFIATQLFAANAPALVILMTIAVVNLRHALYSASVAPYLRHLRPAWKWLLAYLLTDEAYAVGIVRYQQEDEDANKHWHLFGAGITLWSGWQISTAVGIFLGAVVPPSWSLDFTLALTFIALLAPTLRDRPALAAAVSAGLTAVLAYHLPLKLGLVAAALVGIVVGLVVEARK